MKIYACFLLIFLASEAAVSAGSLRAHRQHHGSRSLNLDKAEEAAALSQVFSQLATAKAAAAAAAAAADSGAFSGRSNPALHNLVSNLRALEAVNALGAAVGVNANPLLSAGSRAAGSPAAKLARSLGLGKSASNAAALHNLVSSLRALGVVGALGNAAASPANALLAASLRANARSPAAVAAALKRSFHLNKASSNNAASLNNLVNGLRALGSSANANPLRNALGYGAAVASSNAMAALARAVNNANASPRAHNAVANLLGAALAGN